MKSKRFERVCPDGYRQAKHINAKSLTFGLIFNGIALAVLIGVMAIALLLLDDFDIVWESRLLSHPFGLPLAWLCLLVAMIVYVILHELVHGLFYKGLTGEKLTFGMSWSCAFCGVPHIYVYRRVAILAASAPLVIFTLILLPLTAVLYGIDPLLYLMSALLFGLHFGGCCGDIYLVGLLLFRYRSPETLIRDTGPEQFLCIPDHSA